MKFCDLTLPTPEENLACDEALLDMCEAVLEEGVLRFWEPKQYFVVVGYANQVATDVNITFCEAHGIPILRRCTGGGTVLQGPGCLNYSLVLPIGDACRSILETNRFILEQHSTVVTHLLGQSAPAKPGAISNPLSTPGIQSSSRENRLQVTTERDTFAKVKWQGQTDLAIGGLKFSGNAQRRKKKFLLFHGTFLLGLEIGMVEKTLLSPPRQPEYRRNRSHADFLMNLTLSREHLSWALRMLWQAIEPLRQFPVADIDRLVREKYGTREWNLRL
ncbi:MAG: lipoate--protein ligase family protein [Verrucomicrobia bacterium]|nr:MAG: lipoate--protein ligase family protein [Verrucomicrobiota bacterium]